MSEGGERLHKVLARLGVASRRGAEELIRQGRVRVNGQPAHLGMRVEAGDELLVDGVEPLAGHDRAVRTVRATFMLNKPAGVLSTVRDDRGRPTVMQLVPKLPGLHPVGRLDLDSEGLLLLTTDGDLTLRLTHPRYRHRKTYRVWCEEGTVARDVIERLRKGVRLEDGPARAVEAASLPGGCRLVLSEGRKRQVRRMLAAVGYRVNRLRRTSVGRLELGGLAPGAYRPLEEREIEAAFSGDRSG